MRNAHIRFVVPGQPPSGNHMYEGYGKNRRKTSRVTVYQDEVVVLTRMATREWIPGEWIVVEYDYEVGRDIDCTNAQKVIEDGIAAALCRGTTPPDCCRRFDNRFLPRTNSKMVGTARPQVTITLWNLGDA